MKKLAVLFVFISLLLLSGGQHVNAGTQQIFNSTSSHSFEKKHLVKFTNQDSSNTIIEDADLSIDEEHIGGDVNDRIPNKIFTGNYSLLNDWYLTFSCQSVLKNSHKNFKIFAPFCGQSNPIYITLRVLRI